MEHSLVMHQPGGVRFAEKAAHFVDVPASEALVAAAPDEHRGMVFIPLENENVERNQAIFWPKGRYLSHPAQLFKDYIINLYKDYVPYQA